MNHKTYTFENYIIENDSFGKNLIVKDFSKINDINQKILFQQMLNHPEMNLETGVFSLTDEQILLFWKSYKQEIVDYSSEEYFEALEFSSPYNKKIPYIKTEGAFSSDNYKLKVVFCDGDPGFEEPKLFDANKPSESFISQALYIEKINKLIP